MLNHLQRATNLDKVPAKHTARDPNDSYLLDFAFYANAHCLVTGDKKAGMLELKRVGMAHIITASRLCEMIA